MPLRTLVGDRARALLRGGGWIVEKPSPQNSAAVRRARMLASLAITTVLDVGANAGQYGTELREHGYSGRIVSFEPLSARQGDLIRASAAAPPWEVEQVAVSDQDGESEINVSTVDVWSSLLPRDERAPTDNLVYTATETVRTARLDSLGIVDEGPAWLKLDVQGFELHALRGAERTLEQVVAIECEMSVEPFYEGQPSIPDLIGALAGYGFGLIAVDNGHVRSNGRAMWINGVFLRA
jgi:FkbM family methyltransferase